MSAAVVHVRCPAKVNLALHVVGRRSDGYHELDTIFQAIDLWDDIEAEVAGELTLRCDVPSLPVDASNLVLRAAAELRARSRTSHGASIRLVKRIPVGGGLGGGSSDAAGTLVALRRLWSLPLDDDALLEIAAALGSDVAFFLSGGTARGTGRGERIERLPAAGRLPILLGVPPFGIATKEVYQRYAEALTPPAGNVSLRRFCALKLPGPNDYGLGINDLEAVVLQGWPELAASRTHLEACGAAPAMVSGSGSSVFGVFAHDRARDGAAAALRSSYPRWTWIPTSSVDQGVTLVPMHSVRTDPGP